MRSASVAIDRPPPPPLPGAGGAGALCPFAPRCATGAPRTDLGAGAQRSMIRLKRRRRPIAARFSDAALATRNHPPMRPAWSTVGNSVVLRGRRRRVEELAILAVSLGLELVD